MSVYFISHNLKSHSILIQMVMFAWELKCHGEIICVSGFVCALKTGMIMSNRHSYKIIDPQQNFKACLSSL